MRSWSSSLGLLGVRSSSRCALGVVLLLVVRPRRIFAISECRASSGRSSLSIITFYPDEDVLRAASVRAARSDRRDSEIVEEALRAYLGFDVVEGNRIPPMTETS
jgi:hypothetical protein